ncbi:MAG TPA: hypothetical protein DCF45_13435 [Gammaproteobacteria bacterium]|nr:hypothetical protein [Gammaproteobacteria bacterium]
MPEWPEQESPKNKSTKNKSSEQEPAEQSFSRQQVIIQPSRGARLRMLMLGVAMVVPLLVLAPLLSRYHHLGRSLLVEPLLLESFEQTRGFVLLIYAGVVLVVWFLSYRLALLARNIGEQRRYPPAQSQVLFPTELLEGDRAERMRRLCNLVSLLLIVIAVVLFYGLVLFYLESVALLEIAREFAAMFQGQEL